MQRVESRKEKPAQIRISFLSFKSFVFFPYLVAPIIIKSNEDKKLIENSYLNKKPIFITPHPQEAKGVKKYLKLGTVCQILKISPLSKNRTKILFKGIHTAETSDLKGKDCFILKHMNIKKNEVISKKEKKLELAIQFGLEKLIKLGKIVSNELTIFSQNGFLSDQVKNILPNNLDLSLSEQQEYLKTNSETKRLEFLNKKICKEIVYRLEQKRIKEQTNITLKKSIEEDFYDSSILKNHDSPLNRNKKKPTDESLEKKIKNLAIPSEHFNKLEKKIQFQKRLPNNSTESIALQNYLDTVSSLPWGTKSLENKNIKTIENNLEKEHYGLHEVKNRIIEYLCVKKLNPNGKSPILCLVGPPGVGKTTLGKVIAQALGRKFLKISLGGLKDESEIKGHRRTYVGAYPGKIIEGLKSTGTDNPVLMLDEIDKISKTKAEPSAALLEILDPSQNKEFIDHYLDLPYDLSKVFFIANANSLDEVSPPLRNRLEILKIAPYSTEEKIQIAKHYIWPKELKEAGISFYKIGYEKGSLAYLIQSYTQESGLRSLEKKIAIICRQLAKKSVQENNQSPQNFHLTKTKIKNFLGTPISHLNSISYSTDIGVSFALAYTPFGGTTLPIETKLIQAPPRLVMTGNLGKIMKESIQISLNYLKAHPSRFQIDPKIFDNHEIHIHIPENSISKEGASAGVAITSSLLSALKNKAIEPFTFMTGEITLMGKVLPIGGLKEKLLAAKQLGAKRIFLPKKNLKEATELSLSNGTIIHGVEDFKEVFNLLYPTN